jgi:SAM-dependent methyltransferase
MGQKPYGTSLNTDLLINMQVTRGSGLFEGLLARLRAWKANSLISKEQRQGRILDIGCGSFPYFLFATEFKEKYGLDPSVNSDAVKNNMIFLKKTSVQGKLPYSDKFFDVVTMLAVFEHIEHDKLIKILKEIRRVLKDNGSYIITTPAPWSDRILHAMARFSLISREEIHEHKHNFPKSEITDILIEAGFEKNKIRSGYFEFGVNMWFVAHK